MPLASAMNDVLLVPIVTSVISPGHIHTETVSYDGAIEVPCRFTERAARALGQAFGQGLEVDAVALIDGYNKTTEFPSGIDTGQPDRRQVKIKVNGEGAGVTYELIKIRDLGGVGRIRELELKRWKVD